MSVFDRIEKVKVCALNGAVTAKLIDGTSEHILYFSKPIRMKKSEFSEIIRSLEIKFKLPK